MDQVIDTLHANREKALLEMMELVSIPSISPGRPHPEAITAAASWIEERLRRAGIDEVREVFEFYASQADGAASGRGCLLCNTAIELGSRDPSGAGFVHRYFQRLSRAFRAALANAHDAGQLAAGVDTREEAEFFTASVLGLFVMLRATAPSATIEHAAQAAIRHLDTLCAG